MTPALGTFSCHSWVQNNPRSYPYISWASISCTATPRGHLVFSASPSTHVELLVLLEKFVTLRLCDDMDSDLTLPRSAPSRKTVDAFFFLLLKGCTTGIQRRSLRAAEYFGRAASDARALWGDKGALCVVHVLIMQSKLLAAHALSTTAAEDALPVWLEAQRLLAECRCVLTARLSADTCLVGRCFAVEEDFYARYCVLIVQSAGATPNKVVSETFKGEVGLVACMMAATDGLKRVFSTNSRGKQSSVTDEERKDAQSFTLRCLGILASASRVVRRTTQERKFSKLVCELLASNDLEEPFKAELTRAWDIPALRARGAFDEEDAAARAEILETLDKKAAADKAKHGLRWCALPSCAKQETNVFDFKACSACKAVVYCCAEHGALHWTQGHRKECAALKAAGAKPRSTADAGEGGARGGAIDVD